MSRDRGSRWTRWRVAGRLARRQVWRTKGSSALVVLLVMLPVLMLTAAGVFFESNTPDATERVQAILGRTQAMLTIVGGADPSRFQTVDELGDVQVDTDDQGNPIHTGGAALADPSSVVPGGTRLVEVTEQGSVVLKTKGGIGTIPATAGPVWDGMFRGAYVPIDGAAPTTDAEAMASPGLLARTGIGIGDRIVFADGSHSFRITGTMRDVSESPDDERIFLPSSSAGLIGGGANWYAPAWQPTYAQLQDLNHAGVTAYARDLVLDPPGGPGFQATDMAQNRMQIILMVGSISAAFCGYLVVLLAGAAFAVSARRQQRTLAMIASVGAQRRDVFRIVLLQGTSLGLVGGVVGAGLGILTAATALTIGHSDVFDTFWWSNGLRVPWWQIAVLLGFAVTVGTLATVLPARSATRGDVLGALRGSRRPAAVHARRPIWGVVLMLGGLGVSALGAFVLFAVSGTVDSGGRWQPLAIWAVICGPLLFQIGIIVAGHWLLSMTSRALSRLGLSARVASRDAAAAPSRVIPAFGAIAACVFLSSFAVTATALNGQAGTESYQWKGPLNSASVDMYEGTPAARVSAVAKVEDLLRSTSPDEMIVVDGVLGDSAISEPDPNAAGKADSPVDAGPGINPDTRLFQLITSEPGCTAYGPGCTTSSSTSAIGIMTPRELQILTGGAIPADALARFQADGMLVPWTPRGAIKEDTAMWLEEWRAADLRASYYEGAADAKPARTIHPALVRVNIGRQYQEMAFLTPEAAAKLGMTTLPQSVLAISTEPLSQTSQDRLTAAVADIPLNAVGAAPIFSAETGPASLAPAFWAIIAATAVLVTSASAVCLGLARFERRPDDATLAAVGANRSVRRRVNAWQGLIVVGIGAVVGTVAGIIPMWGIATGSGGTLQFTDTPWGWLAMLALGLPAVVALASWLVPPRHPDLTRRTAIA